MADNLGLKDFEVRANAMLAELSAQLTNVSSRCAVLAAEKAALIAELDALKKAQEKRT